MRRHRQRISEAGPGRREAKGLAGQFRQEQERLGEKPQPEGAQWRPGDGPSQASICAVETLAKAGTLGIIGVHPQNDRFFPIGAAINKNHTINMGNCNHRTFIPKLVEMVERGSVDPTTVLSHVEPMADVIEAYKQFDLRRSGWIKVELKP